MIPLPRTQSHKVTNHDGVCDLMERKGLSQATWGQGRSGWVAAYRCSSQWLGCGACPRLGFATRGRCWPPPGSLRVGSISVGGGGGGGPSPAPAGRVSGSRRSARPGVPAWPPACGVCSSRGSGGASDSRTLPEDFRRNVRRTARPTATRSQSTPVTRMRWSVTPTQHAACACNV